MTDSRDLSILDKHIIGRVKPHIYAFTTGTVPAYLKVGDTYRPVSTRLAEWRHVFPDLESHFQAPATLGAQEDTYFRDYSVHRFLENHGHNRLQQKDLNDDTYYSREFFHNASREDVERAIEDIRQSYEANDTRYAFYDAASTLPQTHHYERSKDEWELRPNQQEAVDKFKVALAKGRKNLLMYAVMRFGKSFTSLACAKAMGAKAVVIVSAKADVRAEWKKTAEIPANFEGFRFLTTDELRIAPDAIAKTKQQGEVPVLFLTLQDLQGKEIKEQHQQVFETTFDLLIIDESHYGARAESYGQVLKESGLPEESKLTRRKELADTIDPDEAANLIKSLKTKVRLHLSGTPYRILMGSEFAPDDIVAFVQFSDIVQEQEAWDKKHLNEDGVNEWDNPYFGFPQMVRFAFHLNQSSRARIEQLRSQGITATLSALLTPKSVKATDDGQHKEFKHEQEVLDLLKIIDGSQTDPHVLGFLDYDKIKDGNMCRHMVMVLPYCASCDAMEELIKYHAKDFKNLADYDIMNISGLDAKKRFKDIESVKSAICQAERAGRKTITLTVNRMLTGSTVEQWDTMLFLKDTSSPQEYDQAIFRLQNQYIRTLQVRNEQPDSEERTIRHCLKPQTLLVDFDPMRMFRMQEQKALIYNVNTDGRGNDELEERLRKELRISPIITINSHQITEVEPTNILDAISNYNAERTIIDEVKELPIDLGILDSLSMRKLIESQAEIGSKGALEVTPHAGEGDDIEVLPSDGGDSIPDEHRKNKAGSTQHDASNDDESASFEKKIRTYYQRILFFAMLAQEPVSSLGDIIEVGERGKHPRILKNLGLDVVYLKLLRQIIDPFKLNQLDYKIQNTSRLMHDERYEPLERAERALAKFVRIADSEIRTPGWYCQQIYEDLLDEELIAELRQGSGILDLASKFGEFSLSGYAYIKSRFDLPEELLRNAFFAVPTSTVAYEFTVRFYEIMGLNTAHVLSDVTSKDLLQFSKHDGIDVPNAVKLLSNGFALGHDEKGESMKFAAVVGNPPYQISDGGARASARPIYQHFVMLAEALSQNSVSMIIPTRWYVGGKGLDDFRDRMLSSTHVKLLVDQLRPDYVFPETNNRGGVCYFLIEKDFDNQNAGGVIVRTYDGEVEVSTVTRQLNTFNSGLFIRDSIGTEIVSLVQSNPGFAPLSELVSSRQPFRLVGKASSIKGFTFEAPTKGSYVKCFLRRGKQGWVPLSEVGGSLSWIDCWKVMMPYANNIGTELRDDNQNTFVAPPGTVCSETFLVVGGDLHMTRREAKVLSTYLRTRFARFLHSMAKISQHGTRQTYRFVPKPDLQELLPWANDPDLMDKHLFDRYGLSERQREHIFASIVKM